MAQQPCYQFIRIHKINACVSGRYIGYSNMYNTYLAGNTMSWLVSKLASSINASGMPVFGLVLMFTGLMMVSGLLPYSLS